MKSTSAKKTRSHQGKRVLFYQKYQVSLVIELLDIGSDHRCHLHHVDGFAFLEIS